jgi:hypothetical protein
VCLGPTHDPAFTGEGTLQQYVLDITQSGNRGDAAAFAVRERPWPVGALVVKVRGKVVRRWREGGRGAIAEVHSMAWLAGTRASAAVPEHGNGGAGPRDRAPSHDASFRYEVGRRLHTWAGGCIWLARWLHTRCGALDGEPSVDLPTVHKNVCAVACMSPLTGFRRHASAHCSSVQHIASYYCSPQSSQRHGRAFRQQLQSASQCRAGV